MIWLIFVGVIVLVFVIYWMGSVSHGRGYRSPRLHDDYISSVEQQQVENELRFRELEKHRPRRGWRRS